MRTLKIPPPHAVLIILIIAAILLLSCSQVDFDNYSDSNDSQRTSESPSLRRFNVSMNTAQTFLDVLEKDKPDTSKREISKILPVAQYGDTLLYVVNFKDDKGWLIVSGDKRTESILAQAEKGVFDFHTDNPGIATWLDQLAEQVYALKHNEKAASDTLSENYIFWNRMEEYARHISGSNTQKSKSLQRTMPVEGNGYWDLYSIKTQILSTVTKGPLLQTKWGQGEPWNTCVPYAYDNTQRCPTGCVAVAGSQMLYYLHYKLGMPETSWETGSCTGSSGEVIHNYHFSFGRRTSATWDTMATRFYQSSTATDLAAILMGYVGSKIGMDYTKDRSGADTKYLVGFFLGEGIQSNFTDYNSTDILGSLSNDMPVILSAKSTVHHVKFLGMTLYTWYEDGHAWVADGYERQQTKYTYYYEWLPADGANSPLKARPVDLMEQTYKTEESISTTNLLIMNWGWDGIADNGRYTLTGDWNATSTYNFVYNRKMIINFAKK